MLSAPKLSVIIFHGVFLWLPQLTHGFCHWLVVNYQAESEDMLWWGGNLKLAMCWVAPVSSALLVLLVTIYHDIFLSHNSGERLQVPLRLFQLSLKAASFQLQQAYCSFLILLKKTQICAARESVCDVKGSLEYLLLHRSRLE